MAKRGLIPNQNVDTVRESLLNPRGKGKGVANKKSPSSQKNSSNTSRSSKTAHVEGFLKKKAVSSSFSYGWKTRWFELNDRDLSYSESKGSPPLGVGKLQAGTLVSPVKNRPLSFQLVNVDGFKRPLTVQCDNEASVSLWTEEIQRVINGLDIFSS